MYINFKVFKHGMDLKSAMKKLEGNREFKIWRGKNNSNFFSYAFKILQEMSNEWQIGFYDRKKDRITTFVVGDSSISIRPAEEVFKKEETKINEIDINKVKVSFDNALEKAHKFQTENFSNNKSIKTIAILQNVPSLGNIWNITYITETFNTLNMKIDASTGKIIEHNFASILSFRRE